jgi:hypothetical protein
MKFSIGDRVVLKQTGEEGHVTAYINKEMIEVEVNGTTFPVYIEEIEHPYLKWFTEKKTVAKKTVIPEQLPVEKEKLRPKRLAKGIYLSFLPVFKQDEMEDIVDVLKVHLLNELPVAIKFSYDVKIKHQTLFRHEGTLHPFGHLYLHSISWADMDEQPRFHWSLADIANKENKVEEGILKIGTAKLFRHINELMLKNEPTFSYMLIEDFSIKKKEEPKEKFIPKPKEFYTNPSSGLATEEPKYELDLHIEKLVESTKDMDNADMLHLQMKTFEKYLNLAIVHNQERMIVIHGLGKGVLRYSIHDFLSKSPYVEKYVNDYHPKYGFGATEIFFKR